MLVITDYTFGSDEISQHVHGEKADGTPVDETLVFGHDGHGSVRVLYDLSVTGANLIEQVLTFSAYGSMLAVHNATGTLVGTNESFAKTSLGYSGEHFDAKAQQQYLRARFYNPANGQFNRLDPFAGNMQDPQSLHKYAYGHGDPIQGTDPSGLMSFSISVAIGIGVGIGAFSAAYFGGGYTFKESVGIGLGFGLGAFLIATGVGLPLLRLGGAYGYYIAGLYTLFAALRYTFDRPPNMTPVIVQHAIRSLDPNSADNAEADKIGSAIANTYNKNAAFEWLHLTPTSQSQRAKGYYCSDWVFAFEDAFNAENTGKFTAVVRAAEAELGSDGLKRNHYFLEIRSVSDPSNVVYVDDGFWKIGEYVHHSPPAHEPGTPPGPRTYLPVTYLPISRAQSDVPPAYDSQGQRL